MVLDDFRKKSMLAWLKNDLHLNVIKCEAASSDASFRRYFRITLPEHHRVVMDAPPDKENIHQFIKVAKIFSRSNIRVPYIYDQNLAEGFLILEDFGTHSFLDKLTLNNVEALYGNALETLLVLQTQTVKEIDPLPPYDAALLQRELDIFKEWFMNKTLGIDLPVATWKSTCNLLINSALEQPVKIVHRDFHSRNLMLLDANKAGVIDFQDAVMGPITYDLVSLLRDCYIAWPLDLVEKLMVRYFEKLKEKGIISSELSTFRKWFDLMGLQRHLKAIGIFSRLNLRDGKSGYLLDIPRTLNYVMSQTRIYPELVEFHDFLALSVLPAYPQIR